MGKINPLVFGLICSEDDVTYNAKVKMLRDGQVKVSCFTKGVYRERGARPLDMYSFYEEQKKSRPLGTAEAEKLRKLAEKELLQCAEDISRSDNIKRAKDKVFEIASANKWDYMVTLTLDKDKIDRYNKEEVKKLVCKWLDNKVQRKGLTYLIVPEYHSDGAIHFHGLTNDKLDFVSAERYKIKGNKKPVGLSTLRKYGFKPTDENVQEVFNVNDFPYGFTTAVKLDDNVTAVSIYMTKYITKDLKKIFGSFYMAGGKIVRELPFKLLDIDFKSLEKFPNCKTVDLPENYGQVRYVYTTLDELNKNATIYERVKSYDERRIV